MTCGMKKFLTNSDVERFANFTASKTLVLKVGSFSFIQAGNWKTHPFIVLGIEFCKVNASGSK